MLRGEPLLALAERLLPRLKAAEWRDRADAALRQVDDVDLRDLRSVVSAAETAARDDESRAVAEQLRAALTARVDREHQEWLDELAHGARGGSGRAGPAPQLPPTQGRVPAPARDRRPARRAGHHRAHLRRVPGSVRHAARRGVVQPRPCPGGGHLDPDPAVRRAA